MTDNTYQPAKVWTWDKSAGGAFANINRPVSGPTHEKTLPVGKQSGNSGQGFFAAACNDNSALNLCIV